MPMYVSAVKGHLAPRYGTARATPGRMTTVKLQTDKRANKGRTLQVREPGTVYNHEFFGLTRVETDGGVEITWDTEAVYLITDAELAKHGREFRQMVEEGALTERKPADFEAWQKKQAAATAEHEAKVAADAKKKTDAAAKAEKKAPPSPEPPAAA